MSSHRLILASFLIVALSDCSSSRLSTLPTQSSMAAARASEQSILASLPQRVQSPAQPAQDSDIDASIQGPERSLLKSAMSGLPLYARENFVFMDASGKIHSNRASTLEYIQSIRPLGSSQYEDANGNKFGLPALQPKPGTNSASRSLHADSYTHRQPAARDLIGGCTPAPISRPKICL
jgi:hypothetical protein